MDYLKVLPAVTASSLFFVGLNWSTKKWLKGPSKIQRSAQQLWNWRNTLMSFIHSCLSAVWSLYCFFEEPKMLRDMIDTWTWTSYSLMVFSTGYFFYDFFDILSFNFLKQWELIIHHSLVLVAFNIALYCEKYIGYGVCSLLMEVNSIFLHARRLLKLSGKDGTSFYSANGVLLLVTFICFRLMTSAWMINWSVTNRQQLPVLHFGFSFVSMVLLTLINIGLLYRLWNSDFRRKKVKKEKMS